MKTAISLAVGFVLAISLAAINEQLFREIAFYAYFAGTAVIAIVVIAAVVVFFGGTSAVMAFNSIRTEIYANLKTLARRSARLTLPLPAHRYGAARSRSTMTITRSPHTCVADMIGRLCNGRCSRF